LWKKALGKEHGKVWNPRKREERKKTKGEKGHGRRSLTSRNRTKSNLKSFGLTWPEKLGGTKENSQGVGAKSYSGVEGGGSKPLQGGATRGGDKGGF